MTHYDDSSLRDTRHRSSSRDRSSRDQSRSTRSSRGSRQSSEGNPVLNVLSVIVGVIVEGVSALIRVVRAHAGIALAVIFALVIGLVVTRFSFNDVQSAADAEVSRMQATVDSTKQQLTVAESSTSYTGVQSPWTASGWFATGNTELDNKVKSFCDERTDSSLSYKDNAYNVYNDVCQLNYVERDDNAYPSGPTWAIDYSLQLFNEDGGNCYNLCAFVGYCLQYFGYDAIGEPCTYEQQSGSWGNHGIVLVKVDGTSYLCDQALGANGWMMDGDMYNFVVQDIGQHPVATS